MAQESYQLINFSSEIILNWPFSFTGQYVVADINDLFPDTAGLNVRLPAGNQASVGQIFKLNNVSTDPLNILYSQGGLFFTLNGGDIAEIYLSDASTADGVWGIIQYTGASSIISFVAKSDDSSIFINGSNIETITPPGGTIDFRLPLSISNIYNQIQTSGFTAAIVPDASPDLQWVSRELIAGNNINITNQDGTDGDPVISLSDELSGITSLTIGDLTISGDTISNENPNGNVNIVTQGTGQVVINGVAIDDSGNIIPPNSGSGVSSPLVPKAYCAFTDQVTGLFNVVTVQDSINVLTVVREDKGTYRITFENPFPSSGNNDYGVLIGLGSDGGPLPKIYHGFYVNKTPTSFIITVTTAGGEPVLEAPEGVTVTVMSSVDPIA